MKRFLTLAFAIVMTAALCLTGCKPKDTTVAPETVTITNTATSLAPGKHALTATVAPEKASQAVTFSLIGSPAGVTLSGSELTVAVTAADGLSFRVKAAAQTDPTVSDTKTFTVNNPAPDAIEIGTEAALKAISLTGNYKLTGDIALTEVWAPLGTPDNDDTGEKGLGFAGTLDGNGYKITGFKTAAGGYNKGFFNQIEATGVVKNLGIESGTGADDGLFGAAWCGTVTGNNLGTISNCYTDVKVTMTGVPGGALVGSNKGTIENCYAIGPVKVGSGAHGAGLTNTNDGTITNSFVLSTSVDSAIGYNKQQNANIQKGETWMKTAQNYKDAGWDESVWCLVDGYYPMLRHEGFTAPAPLPMLTITNAETFLDYQVEAQRTLQITYQLSNVTDNSVTFALESPVDGVQISTAGLVTLTAAVADGAQFTVTVTSVESPTTSDRKSFTVNNASADEVVEISNLAQMQALATSANPADMAKSYRLTADIDLGTAWWNTPIGSQAGVPFTGTFDGNGWTLKNWAGGDGKANYGIFAEIGAGGLVRNLTVEIRAQRLYVGAASAVLAQKNAGTIRNVLLRSGEIMCTGTYVAGVAFDNVGTIENCVSLVKLLINESATEFATVGGIAYNNEGTIADCYVDSTVTGVVSQLSAADAQLDANCLDTAAMQTAATYAGWDASVWTIADGAYPAMKQGIVPSETQPVRITTEEQLRALAASTNAKELAAHYVLMNDIALTEETAGGGDFWTKPIGTAENPFTGIFDGNGFTISNVRISSEKANFAFFGYVSGTVRNLCVDTNGITVTGTNSAVFVQYVNAGGTVQDCMTKGEIRTTASRYISGFVRQNNGTMKNCIAAVVISHVDGANARAAFAVSTSGKGTFTDCIYDFTVAGSSSMENVSTGAVKFYPSGSNNNYTNNDYTTEYLQTAANYGESWSSEIWDIADGAYPTLKNNCSVAA